MDFFPRFWWFFVIVTYVIGLLALFCLFSFIVLVGFNSWFPPKWLYIFQPLGLLFSPQNSLVLILSFPSAITMTNPQLAASSSNNARRPRIYSEGYIPSWENPFPVPQPRHDPMVVEKAMSTFTMDRGVTRVNTHLCLSINVEHMLSRVFMGKLFGQPLDARLIKWKLRLLWKNEVKSTFYLDHLGRKWFALEFTDEDDLKFVIKNRSWYVRGQIFHPERWTTSFKDIDVITKLVVWARLSRVLVQYKEKKVIKDITQPIG